MSDSLGETLRSLRKSSTESLRQVEEKSGVSNAYLSQLEGGKISKPAPQILHKLAEHYGVSYRRLMHLAGYLKNDIQDDENLKSLTPLQVELLREGEDLTREEMQSVAAFIRYMRTERRSDPS